MRGRITVDRYGRRQFEVRMRWEPRWVFLSLARTASWREPPGNRFGAIDDMRDECSVIRRDLGAFSEASALHSNVTRTKSQSHGLRVRRLTFSCGFDGFNFDQPQIYHAHWNSTSFFLNEFLIYLNLDSKEISECILGI